MKHLVVALLFAVACSKSAKETPTTGSAGSSAPAGSAEPVAKGSDMAGSAGSATAGSGAGSGSDMAAGSGAGSGSDAFDFDKLTTDQKMDFMKKQVVPTMKPLFQAFDAKKYANFGCKTCHGKDPKATKYKMPNPELPKLDFAALKAGKQAPKVAEFMAKTVKPEMAKLFHEPEMTETNPKGFGCLECHQMKK